MFSHLHGIFSLSRETREKRINNEDKITNSARKKIKCKHRVKMKRGVWHPRENPTQISRCVLSLPSSIHHPVYTRPCSPGAIPGHWLSSAGILSIGRCFSLLMHDFGPSVPLRPWQLPLAFSSLGCFYPNFFPSLSPSFRVRTALLC